MKKSLWLIKAGLSILFSFVVLVSCQNNHKVGNGNGSKAVEQPPLPPLKEETVTPTGSDKPHQDKVDQRPKMVPAPGTPNPSELDSLRKAMDKLREQEVKKKRGGGCP